VNDQKIQDMGVRKCIYHYMLLINITQRVPFQFFSSKNQHDEKNVILFTTTV